jgi:hypothetical protein
MRTIEEAREIIAALADREGEHTFAREVRAGCWDHRRDVQAARSPEFKARKVAA